MCGICGVVSVEGARIDDAPVRAMLASMAHRGPDGEGLYAEPGVSAGARRLAVIDVPGGAQPIANETGDVTVVFNGEIYNHPELRDELIAAGHRFRTRSDTEVLVHLWEEHGPGMLDRLRGMFAFCLHDARRRETFLARDRLGIKPLVYRIDGDRLTFASEVAVLRHGLGALEIDHERLLDQFRLQYVPDGGTVWRGVRSLPPGHALSIRDGAVSTTCWWRVPAPAPRAGVGLDELAAELRGRLDEAVRERLIADVPLGVFLSGGLDSATVLGLAAAASDRPVRTFSVGFEEAAYDERDHARAVAAHFGAEHRELVVSAATLADHLPALIDRAAAPVTDPALVPTWLLARFARREVTVALTGEGADELFAGYRRHLFQHRYGPVGALPGLSALAGGPLGALMPGRTEQAVGALGRRDPAAAHLEWSSTVSRRAAERLFEPDALAAHEARVVARFAATMADAPTRLAAHLRADQHEWLPNDLLAKVDLATMAASLEARVPFLDHRVVEWAAALPDDARIAGGESKRVLRRAVAGLVPAFVLERPKAGFDLPLGEWLRGPLRARATELIDGPAIDDWQGARPDGFRDLLAAHLTGRTEAGLPLFVAVSILTFLERAGR